MVKKKERPAMIKDRFVILAREVRQYWTVSLVGVCAGVVLLSIILALPVKTIHSETIETYYTTESIQEPYTVNEPYMAEEEHTIITIIVDSMFKVIPEGITVPFTIDRSDVQVFGRFENPIPGTFQIRGMGNRIVWSTFGTQGSVDMHLPPGEYRLMFRENLMWGEDCYMYFELRWTEVESTIKHREIVKYREVPVQVENQRVMIVQKRISPWHYLCRNSGGKGDLEGD
jgi:hypothetical protein